MNEDERGSAVIEMGWLMLVLIVPLIWIVVAVFDVQRGAFANAAAARAAGRAYALADSDEHGRTQAVQAVQQVYADYGVEGIPTVTIICPGYASCHSGGTIIEARVRTSIAIGPVPHLFARIANVSLDATHRVPIGRYRVSE